MLKCPPIPEAAWDRMLLEKKAFGTAGAASSKKSKSKRKLNDSNRQFWEDELLQFDRVAREGICLATLQVFITEWLIRISESPSLRPDGAVMGTMLNVMAKVARLSADQFFRVSVRATDQRRKNVVPCLALPIGATFRFTQPSLLGEDLFNGEFATLVKEEGDRREAHDKSYLGSGRGGGRSPSNAHGTRRPHRERAGKRKRADSRAPRCIPHDSQS